jgi:hypothetical protein
VLPVARQSYVSGLQEFSKTLNLCFQIRMKYHFFSDLVNFECAVKVPEQYISWNMLQAFCLGTLCVGNFIA